MKGNRLVNEFMLQITSGRGPEECWRVVARVLELLLKEARSEGLQVQVIDTVPGTINGTLLSAIVNLKGDNVRNFIDQWEGTIQWIAQSPYRKFHKRKNWFVGIAAFDVSKEFQWNDRDVTYESLKASGPGGQHVNKTESVIRAKHIPSGITVVVSDQRSQHQNKSAALTRLKDKIKQWHMEQALAKVQDQWMQHNTLERGNAMRTFNMKL